MTIKQKRDVKPFPNYRAVSDGSIENKKTGRILKASDDSSGYPTVRLFKNGTGYTQRVHRIILEAFDPREDETLQVNHIDGNKHNNSIDNLEWSTRSENMRHAYANGLNHWEGYNERPVKIVETGKVYKSQAECARVINGDQPNINACLTGRRKTHMGFHFEYADR